MAQVRLSLNERDKVANYLEENPTVRRIQLTGEKSAHTRVSKWPGNGY